MNLTNKVVFVTGAANGIGAACSEALVANGAKVIIADIDVTRGCELADRLNEDHAGKRALFVRCDISDEKSFSDAFGKALSAFKQVDIMLNNAGFLNETRWRKMIDVNLKGTITGTELAVAHMRKDRGGQGGVIINVASELGFRPMFCFPVYSATKHGVIGYTRSLATSPDLADRGILYAVLCPMRTNTPLVNDLNPSDCRDGYYDITKRCFTTDQLYDPKIVADALLSLIANDNINGIVVETSGTGGLIRKNITVEDVCMTKD